MTNEQFYFYFGYFEVHSIDFPITYKVQLTYTYLKLLKHYAYI